MKTIRLILISILIASSFSCDKKDAADVTLPNVLVVQTKSEEVPIYREYVGQVFGFKDIAIWARVEGYLEGIHFKEGSRIKEGTLLYTLESQSLEANVAAKMSRVAEAKTMSVKAKSDLDRIKPLAEQDAVSQSDLDSATAQYEASIESVKAAEANLEAANIQLNYTKIYSPVAGIIGKTKAKVGDFVGRESNTAILNTVSRIDSVLVDFFITETEYLSFIRRGIAKDKGKDKDQRKSGLVMILADGSEYEHKGRVDFGDREVDPATGAMLIQASFPNPEELLRPGQFAKVKAKIDVVEDGILIPQRCVMELQGLYSVYVVDESNKVHKRDVIVGIKTGQFWLITEGLKPNEKVIYEGLQKVKDGTAVTATVEEPKLATEGSK